MNIYSSIATFCFLCILFVRTGSFTVFVVTKAFGVNNICFLLNTICISAYYIQCINNVSMRNYLYRYMV